MDEQAVSKNFNRLRICLKKDELSKELFWLSHLNDGSLIIEVAYANPKDVYYGKISPSDLSNSELNYKKFGTQSAIIPKFVYHKSGQTHFSKDPTIRSAYPVQHIPLIAITEQTELLALYINGNFKNFKDFNEGRRRNKDLREGCKNIIFADKIITIRVDIRHCFRFLIEPADSFYERHPILQRNRHFYPTQSGGVIFNYDLQTLGRSYKCLVLYETVGTPQDDNHVVLFGSVRPTSIGSGHSGYVQFLVMNC